MPPCSLDLTFTFRVWAPLRRLPPAQETNQGIRKSLELMTRGDSDKGRYVCPLGSPFILETFNSGVRWELEQGWRLRGRHTLPPTASHAVCSERRAWLGQRGKHSLLLPCWCCRALWDKVKTFHSAVFLLNPWRTAVLAVGMMRFFISFHTHTHPCLSHNWEKPIFSTLLIK